MNGIYDTLKENGHECKIAAAREKMILPEDSIPIGTTAGVYRNALETRLLDNDGFCGKRATKEFIEKIKGYEPDVIQLHNLHGYYINVEILFDYLKNCGKPVVWTMHDCWPATGHCPHFNTAGCDRYLSGCYSCPLKKAYPTSYGLDQSKRNWERKKAAFTGVPNMTIITPSQWLADILKASFLKCYQIKVIHNGIDTNTFSKCTGDLKERYSLQDKRIVLGVAQNWAEHKGFEDFVKLPALLGGNYQVVMIGLTDEQIKKLPTSIIGIKRTNSVEELVQWYSSAQVFVNLTYQDNFPTVNIEALACGTPVITYDTGGSPEAIDEKCGWVVDQGNLDEVVRTIKTMEEKERYHAAAQERSKGFDGEKKYKEYIMLYQRMMNRNKE